MYDLFIHLRADTMASFHHSGDPYFPNQGNNMWMEEEPEEEEPEEEEEQEEEIEDGPAEPMADFGEEKPSDDSDGDSDAKYVVINPPLLVRAPAHRMGPNGPIPPWGVDIWRLSRQQGQRPPYGMAREFYDLRDGGQDDQAIPFVVRRLRDIVNLAQNTVDQMYQMRSVVARAEQETRQVIRDFHMRQEMWEARLRDTE